MPMNARNDISGSGSNEVLPRVAARVLRWCPPVAAVLVTAFCGAIWADEPLVIPPGKPAKPDATLLVGKSADEVQTALGKPMGKLQTAAGTLWLYPDWKIQFDQKNQVSKVEKDAPARVSKPGAQYLALSEAIEKAEQQRAAENDAARVEANAARTLAATPRSVRIISNHGERVDLPSLLADGKVTIVDFFAPWCGPCRQISPELERMAQDDPNIALVKIDIVQWHTPVALQFGLQSIPNIRVFDRNKRQVGEATSGLSAVKQYVKTAKGS